MHHLSDARTEVHGHGIATYYRIYHVNTPQGVMLNVIFNMLHAEAMRHATDDEKEALNYQRAIFELACEEDSKTHSFYSVPRSQ